MANSVILPKRKRRPVDKTLPVIMALLMMMGLATLFSATYYTAELNGDGFSEVKKQLFGMAIGAVAMFFTSRIPYWFWGRHRVATLGLLISAVLLILVIFLFGELIFKYLGIRYELHIEYKVSLLFFFHSPVYRCHAIQALKFADKTNW